MNHIPCEKKKLNKKITEKILISEGIIIMGVMDDSVLRHFDTHLKFVNTECLGHCNEVMQI